VLQCGPCKFKVETSPLSSSANLPSERWNIENKLFDFYSSKHLKLYNYSICGISSETFLNLSINKPI
jgi:hypothetical protein